MNKLRRQNLEKLLDQLESLMMDLGGILDEEEEYRDNIPENLQGSERYEIADQAVDTLSDALDSLSDAFDSLEEVMNL